MSLEAIQWALFQAPTKNPTEKVILTVMADRVGIDGRGFEGCWASHQWIAESAGVSISTVQRYLKLMEERGLIRRGDSSLVDHLRGDRRPVVWDLNPWVQTAENGADLTGGQIDRPVTGAATTGHLRRNDRSPVTDKPSITIQEPSNPPSSPPKGDTRPTGRGEYLPENWQPNPDNLARLTKKYPDLNPTHELQAFKDYWASASGQRARKRNWDAALRTWFTNARKYASNTTTARTPSSVDAWLGATTTPAIHTDAEIIDQKELPRWTG